MSGQCPPWCKANHQKGQEHVSKAVRDGGMVLEMAHFSGEPEPVVSITDEDPGGGIVVITESTVLRLPQLVGELHQPAAPLGGKGVAAPEDGSSDA